MTRIITYLLISSLLFLMPSPSIAIEPMGTLSLSMGNVLIQRYQSENWGPMSIGDFIFEGDRVRTAISSKAEVLFHDGSVVFIGEDTEIEFMSDKSKKSNSLFIFFGSMWNSVVDGNNYEVESIHALATVKGTHFYTSVKDAMQIYVKEGLVDISNEHGKILANKNSYTSVSKDSKPSVSAISEDNFPDEYNVNQDQYFDLSAPSNMYQGQWHKLSIVLRSSEDDSILKSQDAAITLSAGDGLYLSNDKNNMGQSLEAYLNSGQLNCYVFSESPSSKLTISASTIASKTSTLIFKEQKQSDYILIQFIDEHGNKRHIQANYKKQ